MCACPSSLPFGHPFSQREKGLKLHTNRPLSLWERDKRVRVLQNDIIII